MVLDKKIYKIIQNCKKRVDLVNDLIEDENFQHQFVANELSEAVEDIKYIINDVDYFMNSNKINTLQILLNKACSFLSDEKICIIEDTAKKIAKNVENEKFVVFDKNKNKINL